MARRPINPRDIAARCAIYSRVDSWQRVRGRASAHIELEAELRTETDRRIREHFKRSAARGNLPARPTASGVAFSLFCDAREVGCLVAAREKLSAAGVMLYSASALPRRRRVFRGYSEFASGKSRGALQTPADRSATGRFAAADNGRSACRRPQTRSAARG